MNALLNRGAIVASMIVLAACSKERAAPGDAATLVLRNGVVVTVDSAKPEAQAIAVRGSTILAVGTDAEIEKFIGDSTEVIDLKGRMVMPGFIDSHVHYTRLGHAKRVLDLTTVKSWDEIVAMVAAAAKDTQAGVWIEGRGWHQEKWTSPPANAVEGNPINDELSKVAPNNPVYLVHASGHAAFANKKAFEVAGITKSTANPAGGEILKDRNGEHTGLLRETAQRLVGDAMAKADATRPAADRETDLRREVELAGQEALSKGVTSVHDAGQNFATIDFYKKLEAEKKLPVRLYVMVRRETQASMATGLAKYLMPIEGDDHLTVRSIKHQIDGALGSHGALLLKPYIDLTTTHGLILDPAEEIEKTAQLAIANGFQLNTHAIGDSANRRVLNIYESTFKKHADKTGLRWRIEHAQHLDPADIPRFKQLGVIAAMQGVHATSDGPWIPKRLGDERSTVTSYPWRDLAAAGVVISNGTDTPVERIDPIASFYSSVSRMTNAGSVFVPGQKMTREEALRSYTINGAYAAFEEQQKGSLTAGKLADIIVLSQNIMTVPEADIPKTVVDLTILGGTVRYTRK
jgi:predicted amidohydrolase YtcJ